MDDPTRRCENDTDNETHSPRPPIPSGGLIFFRNIHYKSDTVLRRFHMAQGCPNRKEVNSAAVSLTLLEDESLGWRLSH